MGGARTCTEPGCLKSTREGKPFCPDHVHLNVYVTAILVTIAETKAEQEAEVALANGHVAGEVMIALGPGAASVGRLSRLLRLSTELVQKTLKAMEKQRRVVLGKSNRGKTIAKIKERR